MDAIIVNMDNQKRKSLQKKFLHEAQIFIIYFLFLWFMFGIFDLYERLLLNDFNNYEIAYGYSLIEALILAKVIMIGEAIKLGKRYEKKPLIILVLLKSISFSLLVLILTIFEHLIFGHIKGKSLIEIYQYVILQGINIILAKLLIMFVIFIFFFAFLELTKVMGKDRMFEIFFKSRK